MYTAGATGSLHHDTSFAAGWAAAINRISEHATLLAKDPDHFSIYLARLWWCPSDPECSMCHGSGVIPVHPPARSCVPVWGEKQCPTCERRFFGMMPAHPHLNPLLTERNVSE
jgi:hypothetical protein